MNCGFAEKVSMLIDGELSESESRQVKAHIADCAECGKLEKDFLFFREQIKESAVDFVAGRMKTLISPPEKRFPLWKIWKKGISLPVPVFAVFILILAGLSVWLISSNFNRTEQSAVENPVSNSSAKAENTPDGISIARFDKGGRAEIYVAPRREK